MYFRKERKENNTAKNAFSTKQNNDKKKIFGMEACTENNTIRGILKSEGVFTIHFLLNRQLVIHNNLFLSVTWLHPPTMQV